MTRQMPSRGALRTTRGPAERTVGDGRRQRSQQRNQLDDCRLAFDRIQAEGQGNWKLAVIVPENMPALLLRSLSGDREASRLNMLVEQMLEQLPHADPPRLCLLCNYEFSDHLPAALSVLTAYSDAPSVAVMNGVCHSCAARESLVERIVDKYRETLNTGLRVLPTPCSPGHA